jgi:hypothetical protein
MTSEKCSAEIHWNNHIEADSEPLARWRVGCCLEDVVVGDEAALCVVISASGNCTIRYASHAVILTPLSLIPIPTWAVTWPGLSAARRNTSHYEEKLCVDRVLAKDFNPRVTVFSKVEGYLRDMWSCLCYSGLMCLPEKWRPVTPNNGNGSGSTH